MASANPRASRSGGAALSRRAHPRTTRRLQQARGRAAPRRHPAPAHAPAARLVSAAQRLIFVGKRIDARSTQALFAEGYFSAVRGFADLPAAAAENPEHPR